MEFLLDIKIALHQEIVLLLFIIANIIISLFFNKQLYKYAKWLAILAIICALGVSTIVPLSPNYYAFRDSYLSNIYTVFFKNLVLITSFFVILLSRNMVKRKRNKAFEYFTLLLSANLGAMCLISSNDFLTMFISMELLGISCYLLTAFYKNYHMKEAGMKYLIMGSFATAVFLLGVSYLYGISGTFNFSLLNDLYLQQDPALMFTIACVLIAVGLMFKIGAIPFANWIPDVYEGASYPVGAFLSLVPKIAGFAILGRILIFVFYFSSIMKIILAILALLSIAYGTFGAIRQTNIKRLFGYSSVCHSGFVLLGLSVLSVYSLSTVLFYLFCYIFMNIGMWAAAITFHSSCKSDEITDYKGLLYTRPYYTLSFMVCLVALSGLPPTSGFLAKLYLFSAVSRGGLVFLPILLAALFLTVAGLFFYFNVIKVLCDKSDLTPNIDTSVISSKVMLYACSLVTVLLCLFSEKIIKLCQLVAYYI